MYRRIKHFAAVAVFSLLVLATASAQAADGFGLRAEYRSDTYSYVTPPDVVRIDESFDYPFGEAEGTEFTDGAGVYPFPADRDRFDTDMNGVPDHAFTAVWRGFVQSDTTGTHRFRFEHDDQVAIYVDGTAVEEMNCCGTFFCCGIDESDDFQMTAGEWVPIEIRYRDMFWDSATFQLGWTSDGGDTFEVLQGSNLRYHTTGYVSPTGDTDYDGDVDTFDITVGLQNFTGAAGSGKGLFQGDLDGDGDVDTSDLTKALQTFTGANQADLIYDPITGNVQFDASNAPGGLISQFSLKNAEGGDGFNIDNFNNPYSEFHEPYFPEIDLLEITLGDLNAVGFAGIHDLGSIFPTGLDQAGLDAFLTTATYGGIPSTGVRGFNLVIASPTTTAVPEPGALTLVSLGLVGLLGFAWRRRPTTS